MVVPVVGQGTWNMEHDGRAAAVAALRAGLDAGLTHVDTAEMYGSGRVEEMVGEAIAGRRDQVFLVYPRPPARRTSARMPQPPRSCCRPRSWLASTTRSRAGTRAAAFPSSDLSSRGGPP
jgi:hypothetical protein